MPSITTYTLTLVTTFAIAPFLSVSGRSLDSLILGRTSSGINCDGSSACSFNKHDNILPTILDRVNQLPVGTQLSAGQQLACAGFDTKADSDGVQMAQGAGICASMGSNVNTYTVGVSTNNQSNTVGDVIEDLIYHGCSTCGTAPIIRAGNDNGMGSIVVNAVTGVCTSTGNQPCQNLVNP